MARWNLTVSCDTDNALRSILAERGRKPGDLSRFVERAVNREILHQTVSDVRARNSNVDGTEIERLVDEELRALRPIFWAAHRR
jgi:hypothetical protein